MKIALVHERVGGRAGGGGGVRLMVGLATSLREAGHEVVICCHDYEPATVYDNTGTDLEVRSVRQGAGESLNRLQSVRKLALGMRKVGALVPDDVDVINAHEWPGLRAGSIAAARTKKPLVWTRNDETLFERFAVPDEALYPGAGWRRLAVGAVGAIDWIDARRTSDIIVLSQRNARMVQRAFGRPAHVLELGPAAQFFDAPPREQARRELGIDADEYVVLAFSIFFPHRRFEDVVDAAARLGDIPRLRVIIAGSDHADPGYADRIEARVREHGLDGRVEVRRSGVSEAELRNLYAAANAYVFSGDKQSWGLGPLESLAARTPTVVTTGAGVHEILRDRPGAWVVQPGAPDQMATAFLQIAANGAATELEGTREWIRQELSAERYAERTAAILAAAARR